MSDNKSSESRRKLLKSIAAGSGAIVAGKSLPESWSRPVVDSVMLPAHAQTSTATSNYFGGVVEVGQGPVFNNVMLATLAGSLINDAHANGANGTVCGANMGDSLDVQFQNSKNTVLRKGVLAKDGTEGMLNFDSQSPDYCYEVGDSDTDCDERAKISEITDDYFILGFEHDVDGWRYYRVDKADGCNMPPLDGEGGCEE